MRGKHKIINQKVRSAQKHGRKVNTKQLAACEGKVRWTKQEARQKAAMLIDTRAYKCRFCKNYHVGRKPW